MSSGTPASYLLHRGILFIALVVSGCGLLLALGRPLTQDEVDPFCFSANAIAMHGPSALGERVAGSTFPGGTRFEIPHPPLYNLLLAAAFRIFGPTTAAARGLGLLLHGLSVLLLFALARRCYRPESGSAAREIRAASAAVPAALLATSLYLILPLAIQYPLYIDIDNSILTPALLGLLLLALREDETSSLFHRVALVLWFALCLWAKETTPFIALGAIGIWSALSHGPVHALRVWVPIGLSGTAVFAGSWIAFCRLTGVPAGAFIEFTIRQKLMNDGTGLALGPGWFVLWNSIQWFVSWLSPAFFLLLLLALAARIHRAFRNRGLPRERRTGPADMIALFVFLLFAVHGIYYPGLKYIFPLVGPSVVLIVGFLTVFLRDAGRREVIAATVLAAATTLLLLAFGSDPMLHGWTIREKVFWMGAVPIGAGTILCAVLGGRPIRNFGRSFARSLTAALVACALFVDVGQWKDMATVPSYGDYGERGARELIRALDATLPADAKLVARMDIGYFLTIASRHAPKSVTSSAKTGETPQGRSIVPIGLYRNERQVDRAALESSIKDPALAAIVFDKPQRSNWPVFKPADLDALARENGLATMKAFGDFRVLGRAAVSP